MKAYVRKEEEEGVSPVIATILMVAITVVLAATLYLMVGNMGGQQNVTPPIQFNPKKTGTTNWSLDVSANSLRPIDLKYAIQKADGSYIVTGAQFPTTSGSQDANGVTWYDGNQDGKVDTGDTISINNSGVSSGDTFKITAGATGSVTLP
jgi:flagellin-like protein